MIWTILELGAAGLLSLAFLFVAAFMVRGIVKAIRGEEILPVEVGPEELKRLRAVEKAAREAVASNGGAEQDLQLLGISVALHDLDATRDRKKIKELEDGAEEDR